MASIYKRTQDKSNRRTAWYIGYLDHDGKRRTVKGYTDRAATEKLAHQLEEQARQIRDGVLDIKQVRLAESNQDPLENHIAGFKRYLQGRDVTDQQLFESCRRLERFIKEQGVSNLKQFTTTAVEEFLAGLRSSGLSKQTYNHYLKSLKQFGGWLVKTGRMRESPARDLQRLNVQTDRRHVRRALSSEELTRLVDAAIAGKSIEGIPGRDRAMMYVLAAWTGLRKGEIGSLTVDSFALDGDPPTVTVAAAFSKRKREDRQVLHVGVAELIRDWLRDQSHKSRTDLLFPVTRRVPGGLERKTHKMMERDLEAARKAWINEVEPEAEKEAREASDFLKYRDSLGRFADFHANRHTFVSAHQPHS